MFSLIRRISNSVIPRPDRPWEEDPTSNAPNTRRKRRLSSTERDVVMSPTSPTSADTSVNANADAGVSSRSTPTTDVEDEGERKLKKLRTEKTLLDVNVNANANDGDEIARFLDIPVQVVKKDEGSVLGQVTKGVKEVGLEDKDKKVETEEKVGEVDAVAPETEIKAETEVVEAEAETEVVEAEAETKTKSEDKSEQKETDEVKKDNEVEEETKPESVPLPTETDGELDEPESISIPKQLVNGITKSKAQTQTEALGEQSSPRKPKSWASPKKQQTVAN